jgi:hypothetical protein
MVNCCAMKPPIENPRASSFLMLRASVKAAACCAISSIEAGTSPLELGFSAPICARAPNLQHGKELSPRGSPLAN